ncbi:hypothetical protein DM01DRAFT_1189923 [Hesseltinella vesiculosa]|uniref:Uncharacterized protein n=1 Tax=Hesseltinella vesiculosa TaxID=101127 RepID=A0A1X2GRG7_9FUNG|nr:hypothetical protein DM01DRAFT_1189923 [Hesseltinella vesiculosa]
MSGDIRSRKRKRTLPPTSPKQPKISHTPVNPTPSKTAIQEDTKQKILFALRFGEDPAIEKALDSLLDLSFEQPWAMSLNKTPLLLDLLLDHTKPYFDQCPPTPSPASASGPTASPTSPPTPVSTNESIDTTLDLTSPSTGATHDWLQIMKIDDDAHALPILSDHAILPAESSKELDRAKKIVYIIANYRQLQEELYALASRDRLLDTLLCLLTTKPLPNLDALCLSIVEGVAPFMALAGPDDPWIPCLTRLAMAHDHDVARLAIRSLTMIGTCDLNQLFLTTQPDLMQTVTRYLLSSNDALAGVAMEYLCQQLAPTGSIWRDHTLQQEQQIGDVVGLLVHKIVAPSFFFTPKILPTALLDEKEDGSSVPALSMTPSSPGAGSTSSTSSMCMTPTTPSNNSNATTPAKQPAPGLAVDTASLSTSVPTPMIPDLTHYATLEEPYRCLGWLKDNFEATLNDDDQGLSLEDVYALYATRFAVKKALPLHLFYPVLKMSFRKITIHGLMVRGLQIRMTILHDCSAAPTPLAPPSTPIGPSSPTAFSFPSSSSPSPSTADPLAILDSPPCIDSLFAFPTGVHPVEPTISMTLPQPARSQQEWLAVLDSSSSAMPPMAEVTGLALIAAHLLRILSEDGPQQRFLPYKPCLDLLATQQPVLAPMLHPILTNIGSSPPCT